MSVATQTAPAAPDLQALVARFRAALGRVRPALREPLDAYVAALMRGVDAAHRASLAALKALEADRGRVAVDDELRRQAVLLALEEARRTYAAAVLDLLDDESFQALEGRPEESVAAMLQVLEGIAASFPVELRVRQTAARFEPAPSDSAVVAAAKAGKRLMRLVRKEWRRTVPVADLAVYHTAVFEEAAATALGELRRLRLHAVSGAFRLFRATLQVIEDVRGSAFVPTTAGLPAGPAGVLADQRAQLDALAEEIRDAIQRDVRAIELGVDAAVRRSAEAFADALETAGTVERPARSVSAYRVRRLRDRARVAREDAFEAWGRCERVLTESLAAEAEVTRAAAVARADAARAITALHEAIELRLHAPLLSLRDAVREVVDREAATLFGAGRPLTEALEALDRSIQAAFAHGAPLADEAGDGVWTDVALPLDTLAEELARAPEPIAVSRSVAPLPLDHVPSVPPKVSPRAAPVQRLVEVQLAGRLRRELDALLQDARPELEEARAEVRRIRQAAAYNVAAALRSARDDVRDDDAPDARELVSGVLERAVARLDALVGAISAFEQGFAAALRERVDAAVAEMIEAVRTRDAVEIHERVLVETTRKRVGTSLVSGRRALAAAAAWSRRSATRLGEGTRRAWTWLRTRLGLAEVEKAEVMVTLDQSLLDGRITANLPVIYRQLFTLEPLEWDDFLVGREQDLDTVRQALTRWNRGHPTALAVYGEKGSGKTTLLNAACRSILGDVYPIASLTPDRMRRTEADLAARLAEALELPAAASLEALAAHVRESGRRRIVLVEDAQNLFLRTIGGFDLLREFLAFIAATNRSLFWVVSMDQYAWHYLRRTIGLDDHFGFEIDTTTLEPAAIEEAILARHTVSGYTLRFEPDEKLRASRRWRRLPGERARQELARRHFFDQLARIAEGNIFVALFYWLRSIRAVEEHTLVFGPPRVIDVRFLEQLPLETVHTVAAVIQHGSLSEAEHADLFQRTIGDSRLHLHALADSYLLFRDDDGQYTLNKVLYRPFVRLLKARNVF